MASTATTARPTVAFAHLGCEKNRVDTEHMLGLLAQAGYGVSADEADAQVVVVNTWKIKRIRIEDLSLPAGREEPERCGGVRDND